MADTPDPFATSGKVWPARYVADESSLAPSSDGDEDYRAELLAPIKATMRSFPRSAQIKPGPSEIGGCERKLAHKILFGQTEPSMTGWAATKGTVLHDWLDKRIFARHGDRLEDGKPRWKSNLRVRSVSAVVGGGTLDLADMLTGTIVDFKAPGTNTMKEAKAGRISAGYWTQLQTYGLGMTLQGMDVRRVGLLYLPMCGDSLDEAIWRSWPYDESVGRAALANAERIHALGQVVPDKVALLGIMSTKSDFCGTCPVLLASRCAGHTG